MNLLSLYTTEMHPVLAQEFGNRPGAFPQRPAKLVGAPVANTFATDGGEVVFAGRVTEYLFARITGQGVTPLCVCTSLMMRVRKTALFARITGQGDNSCCAPSHHLVYQATLAANPHAATLFISCC